MHTGHWIMLGLTAALMTLLWMISAASSPKRRGYRWAQRAFWASSLLWISGSLGGIGLNGVNLLTVCAFGLPGYAALWTLWTL